MALKDVFATDIRSLAIMRMAVGAVVITDLCIRATDLTAHYTNWGVLPLTALFQNGWNQYNISIHNMSGLPFVQALLFGTAMVFALMLITGYKTQLATIVTWFLLISLQSRNPFIIQDGDALLRLLLFWNIFTPWGDRYSIDSISQPILRKKSNYYLSIFSAGLILQILYVYQFTAFHKDHYEWAVEGSALYYALSLDMIVWPLGRLLNQSYELTQLLTYASYWMEMLIMPFCLIPFFNRTIRIIAFIILVSFHIGIASTIFVGLFPLISMTSFLVLTPGNWWDKIVLKLKKQKWMRSLLMKLYLFFRKRGSYHRKAIYPGRNYTFETPFLKIKKSLITIFGVLSLVTVTLWNIANLRFIEFKVPENLRIYAFMLRLDQGWGMFAPKVFKYDGWFIMRATLANGKVIDLNRADLELNVKKPDNIVSMYKNDRWRKYSENILLVNNAWLRPYYCSFMVNNWNKAHPNKKEKITNLQLIFMKEETLKFGEPIPIEEVLLWDFKP